MNICVLGGFGYENTLIFIRVIYLIVIKMLKVVAFMKQVAKGLQMGETLVLRTFIVAVSMHHCLSWERGFYVQ